MPLLDPPRWAILERRLIALMDEAIEPVLRRYVREDGSLLWPTTESFASIDGLDDAYESFHNWPLYYVLGGAERFREASLREFEAITRQFTRYDTGHGHPMVVKEYEQGYDWMHQGEGYLFFYLLGLADPANRRNRNRACRYAGFYLNEDPEALNYDSAHRIVTSPHPGSMGPGYRNFSGGHFHPWGWADWKRHYGLPFQGVPGVRSLEDIKTRRGATAMGKAMEERMARGDVATNLAVTSMIAQAYLYTGETKYQQWVRDYVEGWLERLRANRGILPDNVGLSGRVGEYTGGKWYGGYYGWTWPHGWGTLGASVLSAAENATLLLGDASYLELARSQIDLLMGLGITQEGTLYVPHKYGDPGWYGYEMGRGVLREEGPEPLDRRPLLWRDGWFEFQPMLARFPAHLWFMSMTAEDRARMVALRNQRSGEAAQILPLASKDQGGHEQAWLAFLQGEFPTYPEQILEHNLAQVYRRLDLIYQDRQDPQTYGDYYLQVRNPISAEGLVQLTLGAPLPIYNGGLLMARLRYYDVQRQRPGLPADVAALVESIEDERTVLHLANLSASQYREVLLEAGAYGEHQFTTVGYRVRGDGGVESPHLAGQTVVTSEEKRLSVHGPWLQVHMRPGSEVTLDLGMKRFAHAPSLALPPGWGDH
jgi:hypothetical protein